MNSKIYFSIAGVFIALYIITSLGVTIGLPDGFHRVFTLLFALFVFLGVTQQKKEKEEKDSQNKKNID